MSKVILVALFLLCTNVFASSPKVLVCSSQSSSADGGFSMDLEMDFIFSSPTSAALVAKISQDGKATWENTCASQTDLTYTEGNPLSTFAGEIKCTPGDISAIDMTYDSQTGTLMTSRDSSALTYNCK